MYLFVRRSWNLKFPLTITSKLNYIQIPISFYPRLAASFKILDTKEHQTGSITVPRYVGFPFRLQRTLRLVAFLKICLHLKTLYKSV